MSRPVAEPTLVGVPCTAPTWPEWACCEDGETVWVRADLAHQATALASPVIDVEWLHLVLDDLVVCVLDRSTGFGGVGGADDWLLHEVDPATNPQDAAVYARFEVTDEPEFAR